MSPIILESFIEPIHAARSTMGVGGMTSATGFPWRVMRMGWRVRGACSRSARHLALNSEMETSVVWSLMVEIIEYGHNYSQLRAKKILYLAIGGVAADSV